MKTTGRVSNPQAGFTLIELVMVLIIAGITIAFFSDSLFSLKKGTEHALTEKRMTAVADVVRRYAMYNGRLPCPASPHLPQTHQDFGWFDNDETAGCMGPAGVVSSGAGATQVIEGMVPVKSLNLPLTFAYDAWGSRLMFAVTGTMVRRNTYKNAAFAIEVNDTPVPFVIYSVGPDRKGGYPSHQTSAPPVPCNAAPGRDSENCDGDSIFTFSGLAMAPGTNYYDDLIAFRFLPRISNSHFMPNAVVAFRAPACPSGWTRFAAASGRSVIGTGTLSSSASAPSVVGYSGTTFVTREPARGDELREGGASTRQDNGGSVFSAMPPYWSGGVIYCEKE